jgi:uncharacterized membrane protein
LQVIAKRFAWFLKRQGSVLFFVVTSVVDAFQDQVIYKFSLKVIGTVAKILQANTIGKIIKSSGSYK